MNKEHVIVEAASRTNSALFDVGFTVPSIMKAKFLICEEVPLKQKDTINLQGLESAFLLFFSLEYFAFNFNIQYTPEFLNQHYY